MLNSLTKRHKPDILDCIANLSSDEVFTSPAVANKMLDLLPPEVWSNPALKFLDPGCKSGVFLREAAKRLMVGLVDVIPDEFARREHIFKVMLHGLAITELTAQISRRTLYYSKDASSSNSVVEFDQANGNLRYENVKHEFKAGSCVHCGVPESTSRAEADQEQHAYLFIHEKPEAMKFDIIIGNPPYQLKDGGHGASASPLYHKFVQRAIAMEPKYLSMIIPSRWFAGGKGLDDFREEMLQDRHMQVLVDHADASECFPGVEIKGGVCYFLWNREHGKNESDTCVVVNTSKGASDTASRRLDGQDVFIRFNPAVSILDKVQARKEASLDDQVSSRKPFGLPTNFDGYSQTKSKTAVQLFARGEVGWVESEQIGVNEAWLPQWKVLTAAAAAGDGVFPNSIMGKPIVAAPNSACTETYLVAGRFDTEAESLNFQGYLKTRFFRFLVSLRKNTQHLSKDRFSFVPKLAMSESWDDQKLYVRYGLTPAEVEFIDSMIKEMA